MVLISFSLIINEVEHQFRFLLTIVLWKCWFKYLSGVFILSFSYRAIGIWASIFGIWANCELYVFQTSAPTWWFCLSAILKVLVEAQEFLILMLFNVRSLPLWLVLFSVLFQKPLSQIYKEVFYFPTLISRRFIVLHFTFRWITKTFNFLTADV